tara:strand:+ start:167 stop:361 length:195 start_codon:yes stop_codon:yes gene_type:complete
MKAKIKKMKPTKQDKRDIEETILYLNEVAEYISMIRDCHDGDAMIDACDTAVEWLERIKSGEIR